MKMKLAVSVALGGLIFGLQVFAYSPFYTHPDLTEEIAKLFNLKNSTAGFNISKQEIEWLRQGAINEDDAPRWINHFYDPTNKVGWSGKHFGTLTPEEGLKFGSDFAPKPPMPSVDWVVDQESQALYGNQQGNQTWQKAVKSFIDGDRKSAFIALGHVLHLLEDASVPDHTRDDTHADLFGDPGSPYEKYSKEYTNSHKLNLAENLKNTNFVNFANIQEAIKSLAIYSNNNFFSEDTVSNKEFQLPDLDKIESKIENIGNEKVLFLYNQQKQIYLAILNNQTKNYSTNDKSFVLPSYRDHLFPKAVLTGASVINLFFKDVEYYKQYPDKLEPIVPNSREPLALAILHSPKKIAVKIADTANRISVDISQAAAKTQLAINSLLGSLGIQIASNNKASSQSNNELTNQSAMQNPTPAPINPPVTITATKTPKPPVTLVPKPAPSPVIEESVVAITPESVVETPTPAPEVVSLPPAPVAPKPSYVLAVGYVPPPTPPAEETQTSLTNLPNVTSTSDVTTSTVTSTILSSSTVDIATTTITTSSTEPVATSTVSVTTTIEIPTSTPTSTVSVTTTIETSTTTTSSISVVIPEVVINEVAWAGTASNKDDDEWFELYNNTDQDIDLTDWKIFVSGKQVKLSINNKNIMPRGYYLLERKEDSVIRDIGADALYTLAGGFNNKGEKLELLNPSGEKVDEVDASDGWFAGDNDKYRSMERVDPTKNGSDPANWQSNQGYRLTGLNAGWLHVYGSPRQSNFGYVVLESPQEDTIRTLDIKNSPYVVQYYTVPEGKTLNIEPDVNIFLITYGSMEINGSLNALGTQDKPVNFLPYPTSTNWGHLEFKNSTSTLNFVNVKQGDRITRLPQNLDGMILANNSNLTINNATLWDSEANVIGGTDSVFNILNTAIGATVKKTNYQYGINVRGGVLSLDNVSFTNLYIGVEAGCSDCSHPELHKTNMSNANFINVDYLAEPLTWWNVEEDEVDERDEADEEESSS